MTEKPLNEELSDEELEETNGEPLPDREAMSILSLGDYQADRAAAYGVRGKERAPWAALSSLSERLALDFGVMVVRSDARRIPFARRPTATTEKGSECEVGGLAPSCSWQGSR